MMLFLIFWTRLQDVSNELLEEKIEYNREMALSKQQVIFI